MEDTLITFETAKLAKEKGFTQNPYVISYSYRYEFTDNTGCVLSNSLFNPSSNICTVPTQSLLAKWLREKHNIHLIAYKNINIDGYDWCYITTDGITNINSYKTYEEAYEIGLQEALKLI